MEIIKVIVNEDCMTAVEVNRLGEKPPKKVKTSFSKIDRFYNERMLGKWQQAESERRIFKIDGAPIMWSPFAFKKQHEAMILPNGKIKFF